MRRHAMATLPTLLRARRVHPSLRSRRLTTTHRITLRPPSRGHPGYRSRRSRLRMMHRMHRTAASRKTTQVCRS